MALVELVRLEVYLVLMTLKLKCPETYWLVHLMMMGGIDAIELVSS